MASIYLRGNTYWVKFQRNGIVKRSSLETSSKRQALKRKEAVELQIALGKFDIVERDCLVEDFWKEYSAHAQFRQKSPRTIDREHLDWKNFIGQWKPETLGEVNVQMARRHHEWLVLEKKYKAVSANDAVRRLGTLYEYAKRLDLYSGTNPFRDVTPVPVEKKPPRFLSLEECQKLLDSAEAHGPDMHCFAALGIYAGLRLGEIVNATWTWIDFEQQLVHVQGSDSFRTKNRKSRTIPLSSELAEILSRYKPVDEVGFIISSAKEPGKWRLRYEPRQAFSTVVARAKIGTCTPHTLRHSFASLLAIRGISIYKISKWLGHSSVVTTMIYSHLAPQDKEIDLLSLK